MKKVIIAMILLLAIPLAMRYRQATRTNITTPTPETVNFDPFYIDDFSFWPSSTVTGSLKDVRFSWPLAHEEAGLLVFKEDGQNYNYLFVIDPTQKAITIKNLFGSMGDHWEAANNPLCVINGGFFEPGGDPSFPIIENSNILPGKVTEKYDVRLLSITGQSLMVYDVENNSHVRAATWAMSGLTPAWYSDDSTVTNRTLSGVKDNLLYIIITRNRTVDALSSIMTQELGINPNNIVAFDSGYSTQVRCFNQDLLKSKSPMGSTLIISNP